MKKFLIPLLLLLCMSGIASAQVTKPDLIRSPNGPNTIVDWNVKFKTMIIPHYLVSSRPAAQDTVGQFFLNTDPSDAHIYYKGVDLMYHPLANLADVGSSTNYVLKGDSLTRYVTPSQLHDSLGVLDLTVGPTIQGDGSAEHPIDVDTTRILNRYLAGDFYIHQNGHKLRADSLFFIAPNGVAFLSSGVLGFSDLSTFSHYFSNRWFGASLTDTLNKRIQWQWKPDSTYETGVNPVTVAQLERHKGVLQAVRDPSNGKDVVNLDYFNHNTSPGYLDSVFSANKALHTGSYQFSIIGNNSVYQQNSNSIHMYAGSAGSSGQNGDLYIGSAGIGMTGGDGYGELISFSLPITGDGAVYHNDIGGKPIHNDNYASYWPAGDTTALVSYGFMKYYVAHNGGGGSPTGSAGGDLGGIYPNPTVSKFNGQLPSYYLNYANLTGTPSALPPNGSAGGDLAGSYPNPTVNQINGVTKSYYDPTSSIQTQLNGKQASLGYTPMRGSNNLSEIGSASSSRSTLGLAYTSPYNARNNLFASAYGNSLTAGNQANGISYPSQFSQRSGFTVYNGGIGGEISSQTYTRWLADTLRQHYAQIVFAWGRNNFTDTATVMSNYRSFKTQMASIGNSKYVVLGEIKQRASTEYTGTTNSNLIDALNTKLSALFGSHFVDINAILVASYNPSIPQDVIDHTHGVPPFSLHAANDSLHLSTAGYGIVANSIPIAQLLDTTTVITNQNARGRLQNLDHVDLADGGNYSIAGNTVIYQPNQVSFTGTEFIGTGLYTGSNPAVGAKLVHSSGSDGFYDTYTGYQSGLNNTTGSSNNAHGAYALASLTTGYDNSAPSSSGLRDLTTGHDNTELGYNSGRGITTGHNNLIAGDNLIGLSPGLTNRIIFGVNGAQSINISGGSTPSANLVLRTGDSGGAADLTSLTVNDLPSGINGSKLANSGWNDIAAIQGLGTTVNGATPGLAMTVVNTTFTLFNGSMFFQVINVPKTDTLTGVDYVAAVAGSYTASGYNGIGLYTFDKSTGTMTLVDSTANNGSQWTSSTTWKKAAFVTPYVAAAGDYYVAIAYNESAQTTAPTLQATAINPTLNLMNSSISAKISGTAAKTHLPATLNVSATSAASNLIYLRTYK